MSLCFRTLTAACLALCCLATHVSAQPPGSTLRTFAYLTGPSSPAVDWEAAGSKRMVAMRATGAVETFITPNGEDWFDSDAVLKDGDGNIIFDFRSKRWLRAPVLHVTETGAEEISHIYWLEEDLDDDGDLDGPSVGLTAATGPDGEIFAYTEVRVSRAPSSDFTNPDRLYLNADGNLKLYIAVGAFQK